MTQLLETAIEQARRLPVEEQDAVAQAILDMLESDRRWDALFNDPRSPDLLKQMADEALEEERAGRTTPLDPDAL